MGRKKLFKNYLKEHLITEIGTKGYMEGITFSRFANLKLEEIPTPYDVGKYVYSADDLRNDRLVKYKLTECKPSKNSEKSGYPYEVKFHFVAYEVDFIKNKKAGYTQEVLFRSSVFSEDSIVLVPDKK